MPAGLPNALVFATTRWSVILAAGAANPQESSAALETLCRAYWHPLHAYLRRAGRSPEDAEDLTQEFFARLLRQDAFTRVAPNRGRFRNFLLVALRHFLIDESARGQAGKRGGGIRPLSLDAPRDTADAAAEPAASTPSPEASFDRLWAETVLARARARLRDECAAAGRSALYEALGPEQSAGPDEDYAAIAARSGLSVAGVKSAAFRLRRRYRELIRAEVAETVSCAEDLEDELRHLLHVIGT